MGGERARGLANPARSRQLAERLSTTADLDFGIVAAGATATAAVTLAGVQPGDHCQAQEPADLDAGLVVRRAYCDTPHVITVIVKNDSAAPITDTAHEWRVSAYRVGP